MIARVAKMYDSLMLENSLIQKNIKSLRSPEQAAKTALSQLEEFIKNDEFGIYRGEAFLSLADYYLSNQLNYEKTEKILNDAEKWFYSLKFIKSEKKFKVPFKAQIISSPNSTVYEKDIFGNIEKAKIKPEMIINRNTSLWYINSLKTKLYSMKGFINFFLGNKQKALDNYKSMKKFDLLGQVYNSNNDWNDYDRLVWGAEHGYFYALPSELEEFGDKAKFAVLVGDYYYITMQFEKSGNIFTHILFDKRKKFTINKPLKAYCQFMIGNSLYWKDKRKSAFELWLNAYFTAPKTYTGERGLFAAGQIAITDMGEKMNVQERKYYKQKGLELLTKLSQKANFRDFKNQAKLALAMFEYKSQNYIKAKKMLQSINTINDKEKQIVDIYFKQLNLKEKK